MGFRLRLMLPDTKNGKIRNQIIIRGTLVPVILIAVTFWLAGRIDYWQGWVYNGLNSIILALTFVTLSGKKDLIEERLKPGPGMKVWDKIYFILSSPTYFLAIIIASLDAGRYNWQPPVPVSVTILAVFIFVVGHLIVLWAKWTNRFFATVVRIQSDRGQTVCKDGPYRFVRHPGYVGGIMVGMATPLVLGSFWALVPAIGGPVLLIVRTYLEDKTLKEELPGYLEYTREVRFRLVPKIW